MRFVTLIIITACSLFNSANAETWDSKLSVSQLVVSALKGYQLKTDDHLLVTISTTMSSQSSITLPRGGENADTRNITVPIDSDQLKKVNGKFQLSDMLNAIKTQVTKIKGPQHNSNPQLCGQMTPSSQVVISLSNCTIGTLSHTFSCVKESNQAMWKKISTDQTAVSFPHKCIAAAE